MAKYTIKLGEKSYEIPSPFPLGLLREVEPKIVNYMYLSDIKDRTERTIKTYDYSQDIVVMTIKFFYPDFTLEALLAVPMMASDMVDYVKQIARASGIWKDPVPGEATGQKPPKEASPSNGALSTQSLDIP